MLRGCSRASVWALISLLGSSILITNAQAEVYRWTDEHGRVHFSDQPVEKGAEQVEIQAPVAPSRSEASAHYRQRQQQLLETFAKEREERQQRRAEQQKKREERKLACQRAGNYQRHYERANLLYTQAEDGSRRYLSEDERQQAEAELADFMARNCDD